jgi:hypothetical protein
MSELNDLITEEFRKRGYKTMSPEEALIFTEERLARMKQPQTPEESEFMRQFEAFLDLQVKRFNDTIKSVMEDVEKFHNDVAHKGESGPINCALDFMILFKEQLDERLKHSQDSKVFSAMYGGEE